MLFMASGRQAARRALNFLQTVTKFLDGLKTLIIRGRTIEGPSQAAKAKSKF